MFYDWEGFKDCVNRRFALTAFELEQSLYDCKMRPKEEPWAFVSRVEDLRS